MLLLAAWALLLHRLAGQDEVVIGTPVRGRALPEVEKVMGFFVNALPLRLQIAGIDKKLGNEGFVAKAPPAVIEKERQNLAALQAQLAGVEQSLRELD
jgi:non-ribosomal peptide synthetase component F